MCLRWRSPFVTLGVLFLTIVFIFSLFLSRPAANSLHSSTSEILLVPDFTTGLQPLAPGPKKGHKLKVIFIFQQEKLVCPAVLQ